MPKNGESAARLWPPLAAFIDRDRALAEWADAQGPLALAGYEFFRFGIKQAWACLFGGALIALIVLTRFGYPHHAILSRYDVLLVFAVAIQILMLVTRLETLEEAKVIVIFHLVGTLMEVFKTSVGSWAYPEHSLIRIGGVPLFTGFMYAAVGSYLARVWRLFDFKFLRHPSNRKMILLSLGIYGNFYTDHYGYDFRITLIAASVLVFGRTAVFFKVRTRYRRMPLVVGLTLVALFIWVAENVATAMGIWRYPTQVHHWSPVPILKLEAWFLLLIVSYTLIALVQRPTAIADGLEKEQEDLALSRF